jgi:hypothetical protein
MLNPIKGKLNKKQIIKNKIKNNEKKHYLKKKKNKSRKPDLISKTCNM